MYQGYINLGDLDRSIFIFGDIAFHRNTNYVTNVYRSKIYTLRNQKIITYKSKKILPKCNLNRRISMHGDKGFLQHDITIVNVCRCINDVLPIAHTCRVHYTSDITNNIEYIYIYIFEADNRNNR
jgi:hypothetical protein